MTTEQIQEVQQGLRHLMTALANVNLYYGVRQQGLNLCEEARQRLENALAGTPEFSILLVDDKLIADGTPLGKSHYSDRFVAALKARHVGHVKFCSGVTVAELQTLAEGLSARGRDQELRSTPHVRLGKVSVGVASERDSTTEPGGDDESLSTSVSSLSDKETLVFREIIHSTHSSEELSASGVSELVSDLTDRLRIDPKVLRALVPLSSREERTITHATTVAALNLFQAMNLGFEGRLLQEIGVAGMLHDIGKLFIPGEILVKRELDDTEQGVYEQHALRGALFLLDSPWVPKLAVITAFEHHRRYDGTGYPRTGLPLQQNICSMITAISDAFDTLSTVAGTDFPRIEATLAAAAGTALHPGLTRRFLELMVRHSG